MWTLIPAYPILNWVFWMTLVIVIWNIITRAIDAWENIVISLWHDNCDCYRWSPDSKADDEE